MIPAKGRYDLVVIGGGIVGLATAYRLLQRRPGLRLAVLEKEGELAFHQSGHNTGVIHAGIYYRPGSLKSRLCREGKGELQRFADTHGIPWEASGKLIVALDESELPRLSALAERGRANGVDGLDEIGPERMREIEPHIRGLRALHSPFTGIIDFRRVAFAIAEEVVAAGGEIRTGCEVTGLTRAGPVVRISVRPSETGSGTVSLSETGSGTVSRLKTGSGTVSREREIVEARWVIACAGLQSDRVAAMTGDAGDQRIVPFRGDYWVLAPRARSLVAAMVNPVPDPSFPFLGVHFTRRLDGEVWAGPNAVPAFAREGYRLTDVSVRDLFSMATWPGFWRLIGRYSRTGLRELTRDAFKSAFLRQLQRYLPELRDEDLLPGPSGVRAQALDRKGNLLDDFSFGASAGILHVRNAPSPAATSSLAIGRWLAGKAEEQFGIAGEFAAGGERSAGEV